MKFNTEEVFNRYTYNDNLEEADILHLYDIGNKHIRGGYNRAFKLVNFNTETKEMREVIILDTLKTLYAKLSIQRTMLYSDDAIADESIFFFLSKPAKISNFQCVELL